MLIEQAAVRVAHCTLLNNHAYNYGSTAEGIRVLLSGDLLLENSILWDDPRIGTELVGQNITVNNCIIRSTAAGATDAKLESLTGRTHNWIRLRADSPAVDAGSVLSVGKRDQTGALRVGLP